MKNRGLFITGTDTGVGKTVITGALSRHLVNNAKNISVMKPFSSGGWSDTYFLKKCSKSLAKKEEITPFYFKYPLAPLASLKYQKESLTTVSIRTGLKKCFDKKAFNLVEGIGGALVPITKNYLAIDVAKDLDLPVLVVARLSLGTINHTLLTLEAIRSRGLKIAGLVINASSKGPMGRAERSNPGVLKQLSKVRVWGQMPFVKAEHLRRPDKLASYIEKHIDVSNYLC